MRSKKLGVSCLVFHLGCFASAPVMIVNTANPLFQPNYQLCVYTGILNVTLPQGDSADSFLMTQSNINLLGFINGSLVGNGYSTNYINSTRSTQPLNIGLSGTFSLNTQNNANISTGITDLTELCQRYSGYVASVQYLSAYFTYWGLQVVPTGTFFSLPASIRLSESNSTDPSKNVLESLYWYDTYTKSIITVILPKNSGGIEYFMQFNAYALLPFLIPEQQKNIFLSIIKNEKYPSVFGTPLSLQKNALPQFLQLQNWLTTNITMQFSLNGFPSMPSSLMSMNSSVPYNVAYSSMLTSILKPAASITPATSTFVLPALFGGISVTQYNNVFGSDTFFLPLLMADPVWTTALAQSSTRAAFSTPYEYPTMKLYEWQQQGAQEIAAQKIGYAGDVTQNAGGGITPGTDFDPRKSPLSDFYNMLLF